MYVFLDEITFRYRGAQAPALDRLSLYVRSGEIAAVVGGEGVGKTTLLRYVGKRSDGAGGVLLGSDADESGRKPGLIRGWRFSMGDDAFPPQWRSERWRGVWIRRYAFPNMALDGSDREPPGGWSDDADNVHFSIHSTDGTVRNVGWTARLPTTRTGRICCWSTTSRRNRGSATQPTGVHSSETCTPCIRGLGGAR